MFNKVILIGYVIQNEFVDEDQISKITLETYTEPLKRTRHSVIANKKLYDIARNIATAGEFIRVEGVLSYSPSGEAKVYAHNIGTVPERE